MKADTNLISDSYAMPIVASATFPKIRRTFLPFLVILLLFSASCSQEEITEIVTDYGDFKLTERKIGQQLFNIVEGSISQNFTFSNDIGWILEGGVFVNPGATLTIEPGTRVYGAFNEKTSFLSVLRGARIVADGTADNPILFTTIRVVTSIPQPGDWGGIIINGRAPINVSGGEAEGEGGTGLYGGQDTSDNSGILRYVIVEYGGKILGTDNELNNISLNALGSETTVEYVEALYGKDDGIEIFGGNVNLKYVVSMGNSDDCIDWTYGWRGKGQFWVVNQDPFSGDKGIEADNNEDNFLAVPFSEPVISNITILGKDDGDGGNTGIRLRHGTKGKIYNAVISGFSKHGFEVQDSSQNYIQTGEILLENSIVFNNATVNPGGKNFENSQLLEEHPSNSTSGSSINLNGYVGVMANGSINPSALDPWFSSVSYIGAVPAESNWTEKWVNQLR